MLEIILATLILAGILLFIEQNEDLRQELDDYKYLVSIHDDKELLNKEYINGQARIIDAIRLENEHLRADLFKVAKRADKLVDKLNNEKQSKVKAKIVKIKNPKTGKYTVIDKEKGKILKHNSK